MCSRLEGHQQARVHASEQQICLYSQEHSLVAVVNSAVQKHALVAYGF